MGVFDEISKHIKIEGITSSNGSSEYVHSHMFQTNENGDGKTVSTAADEGQNKIEHIHEIKEFKVKKSGEDKHNHHIEI